MKSLVYFFGLLSMLMFAACEVEVIHEHHVNLDGEGTSENVPGSNMVVQATIGQETMDSRTVFSGKEDDKQTLVWNAGDEISICTATQKAIYSTEDENTQSAEFFFKSGYVNENSNRFVAFYPSSLSLDNMKLPAVQDYIKDNVSNFPMYAYSTNKTFEFKNLCGIIRLRLKTTTDAGLDISKIYLTSASGGMSGEFTLDDYAAVVKDQESDVMLQCGNGVQLNDATFTDFNIVVPKGEYEPLFITIVETSGTAVTYRSKAPVSVSRSCITRISLVLNTEDFTGSLEDLPIYDADADFEDERGDEVGIAFSMTDEDVDLVTR